MNCKATFELRKGNETITETRDFQFSRDEDLLAQIRLYVEAANRKGFKVNSISTKPDRQETGEGPGTENGKTRPSKKSLNRFGESSPPP